MDNKEILKLIYKSTKKNPFFIEVPSMNYLSFEGSGHPDQEDFQKSCEALFTLSYIIKFEILRKKHNIDYKVSPMEVNWDLNKKNNHTEYKWKMMIMQPDIVDKNILDEAVNIVKAKGKTIEYDRVNLETISFGKCIQCFHLGDYNNMNDTLNKMIDFAKTNNLDYDNYTHDIYLNDMRKTKVENYKTIMRIKVYEKE